MTDEHRNEYECVKSKFDEHFVPRRNVIFERAKFNMRRQEESESVDAYITDLYTLAEHCDYGALHNEMIRDRIVVGIRNRALSEKMQLDSKLTLDSAVTQVRQSEAVKLQQAVHRGNSLPVKPEIPVGAVQKKGGRQWKPGKSWGSQNSGATNHKPDNPRGCPRCGKIPGHIKAHCPAKDAICRK